jgi:hypothetical protein
MKVYFYATPSADHVKNYFQIIFFGIKGKLYQCAIMVILNSNHSQLAHLIHYNSSEIRPCSLIPPQKQRITKIDASILQIKD